MLVGDPSSVTGSMLVLDNDLVDEMTLIVVPVVLGQGARLFAEAGPDLALVLRGCSSESADVPSTCN
jgi:dihydrofolate reductase